MSGLATLDWVLVAVILFFAVKGGWRGLVRESLGYLALLLGIVSLLAFGDKLAAMALGRLGWPTVPTRLLAYALAFLIPYITMIIIAHLLKRFTKAIELGGVDRVVGTLFGSLVGAVFAGALLVAAERVGVGTALTAKATLAPTLKEAFSYVVEAAFGAWSEIAKLKV